MKKKTDMNPINSENLQDLKTTCQKMISLIDENVDGALMFSQLQMLGENIRDFVKNPIVEQSGIVTNPDSVS
ncbi:MAG TPA: hypothetical protein PLW92_03825 [Chitinophagales bacterium]|nr:hypothetical protein [Chitinophagales bacterium]